ncbi:MAG: alpha/beta fold hydrolase [Anaerolineae bacterium]|nr:alpha/beta fold hydrolase [Anaerolineae bacterium]
MKSRFLNLLLILAILLPGAGLAQASPLRGPVAPPASLPPWDKRAANSAYGGAADEAFAGAHPALATLAQFQAAYAASPGATGTLPVAVPRYYGANSGGVLSSAVVNYAVQQAYLVVCSWDLGSDEAVSLRLNSGVTLSPHGAAGAFYCDSLPLDAAALQSLRFPTTPGTASSPTDSNNGPTGSPTPANNTLTIAYPAGQHALIYEARLVVKAVRPVVLVPGFGGEASTYAWGEVENLLKNSYGVVTERPCDYEWEYTGWWPFGHWQPEAHHRRCFERVSRDVADTGTLATNSLALRYAVAEVKTRYGVAKVNLVGHSKGGMFSRAYASASFYQGDVENLVSISSPQRGGYVQDVAVGTKDFPYCDEGLLDPLCELGRGTLELAVNLISDWVVNFKPNNGDQAGLEVTEWYYDAVLHAQHRPAAGVAYHSVAATSGLPAPNQDELDAANHGTMAGFNDPLGIFSTLYTLNYYSDQTPNRGQSDILIGAPAQRFANMDSGYQAQEATCGAIRANHEQSSIITTAGRAAARALGVRNSNTSGILSCAGITDLAGGAAMQVRPKVSSNLVSALEFGGLVAAGQPLSAKFVVDGESFSVAGLLPDAGAFRLTLQAPDGTWLTPETPQSDDGVVYNTLALATGSNLAQYTVAKALPGTWTATFTPLSSVEMSQPAAWKLLVVQTGGVQFALATPQAVYRAGEPVALQAVALSGGKPLTGGRATVTLSGVESDAKAQTVSLADVAPKSMAPADGVYDAVFAPSAPGIYYLTAEFTGVTPEGVAYQRQDSAVFAVAPDGAELAGVYGDAGVDKDGDGLWDALRVDVGVRLARSGEYTLIGDLRAADGTPLGSARAVVSGEAGAKLTGSLEFAPDLLAEHAGGPLVLGALRLLAQDQPIPIAVANDVYTTAAYDAANFAGWEARLGDKAVSAQGVDLDGDGVFDALDVSVPLEVRGDGGYTVAARLTLRPDLPQVEASTRVELTGKEGQVAVVLRFPGQAIASSGVDGAYTIANLTVEGPLGLALVAPLAGTTQAFDHTQFGKAASDGIPTAAVAEKR